MLLCLVMCFTMLPITASAEDEYVEPENEEWIEIIPLEEEFEAPEAVSETNLYEPSTSVEEVLHEHVYASVVTEPSCTEYGFTTYTCECGDSYTDDYVEPLMHSETIEIPEIPATETSTGTTAGTQCALCGEILDGCEEIPMLEPAPAEETVPLEEVDAAAESNADTETEEPEFNQDAISNPETAPVISAELPEDPQLSADPEIIAIPEEPEPENSDGILSETPADQTVVAIPEEENALGEAVELITDGQAASQDAMMTSDTTAPVVNAIILSKTGVTKPDEITMTLGITDPDAAVKSASVFFRYSDVDILSGNTTLQSDGTWKGTIAISEKTTTGKYTVEFVHVVYVVNGENKDAYYYGEGSTAYSELGSESKLTAPFASLSITVSEPEKTPASEDLLKTPTLSGIKNTKNGVSISWKAVSEATEYQVFRKGPNDSDWGILGVATERKYTDSDVVSGTQYSYAVKATNATAMSEYSSPKSIRYVAPPVISSVTGTKTGVTVKWTKSAGAKQYQLYRKAKIDGVWGGWSELAVVGGASYVDKAVSGGTQYGYRLRSLDSDGNLLNTGYSGAKSIRYVAAPKISSVTNTRNGVTVKWAKVAGAKQYQLYRRVKYDGVWDSWTELAVVKGTSYVDTSVISGTQYAYRLRSMDGNGNIANAGYSTGKSRKYVAVPAVSSIANTKKGVTVKWAKVAGAKQYQLYRKVKSDGQWSSWRKLALVSGASYVDKAVKGGTQYGYRLRALDGNGKILNTAYSATKSKRYVTPPTISSVTGTSAGLTVEWKAAAGAKQYQLYRRVKTGDSWGGWNELAVVSETSYLDKAVKGGTQYGYRLRSLDSNGKLLNTGYSATKSAEFVQTVVSLGLANATTGVAIHWSEVSGASMYRVLRKKADANWTILLDTAYTSYTDKDTTSGIRYSYLVRPMDSNRNYLNTISEPKTISYLAIPILLSAQSTGGIVKLNWAQSGTATGYWVYRKGPYDYDWSVIGNITGLTNNVDPITYFDRTAVKGTQYSYTIRAYSSTADSWSAMCPVKNVIA